MKKYLIVLAVVLFVFVGCASLPNNQGSEYMKSVEVSGDAGLWTTNYYVDEFKNPTSEGYVMTVGIGKFTNSATNGSDLLVNVICNMNNVEIELLEYGNHPISIIGNAVIKIKINANGQTIDLGTGFFSKSTKRISINNCQPLFQALVENEKVTMYVTIEDYGRSTYLFDIYSAGFEYNYHEAFLK